RGWADGRAIRLSLILARDQPVLALMGSVNELVRDRLLGADVIFPLPLDTPLVVAGYRTVVENFIRLHDAPAQDIEPDRIVNMPSIVVTPAEIIDGLNRVAAGRILGRVRALPDPQLQTVVKTLPKQVSFEKATS